MANKPLKSIKFPELPDTYTIPQVDLVPTQGSNNAVSSGGVYEALHNTDTTLSQSGQAADALETGKIKEDLYENERFNKSEWENGGISCSTGENVTNSSRIRTKSFLPWGTKKIYSTNANVRFLVYAYNSSDAYVGGWWGDGTFNPTDVKGVSSVDFNAIYSNPTYSEYRLRACIYINGGTARVETISDVYIDSLPVVDFIKTSANLTLERVEKIPNNTDFDSLLSAGNYYVENYASISTMLNTPPEAAQGGRLWVGYNVSALRPYQIWLSFSIKDEPYFYMRIRKADAWGKWNLIGKTQPVNIRVLGYNIGKFNYGFDHTSPHVDDINTKIVNYKKMFGKVNSDLMLFAELTDYIDTSDTINTDTTLIQPLFKTRVNFHGCASVTNLMASKLENDGGVYLRNNNKEYAGAVGRLVCNIGNRKLIISGGFLRVLSSAQDRLEAFKNYINSIIDYDYSIIYLDTNVLNNEERETLYSEAVAAGYTVCNGGYFGLINTLVPTDMYKPIDNIFVKGNIKVKNFEVLTNEYDNLASDHLPIVADLTLY